MSNLKRRLHCLETVYRGRCPECGAGRSPAEYEVVWNDSEDQEPEEPEYCETCGRQIVYIVTWDDIEPGEGGR